MKAGLPLGKPAFVLLPSVSPSVRLSAYCDSLFGSPLVGAC